MQGRMQAIMAISSFALLSLMIPPVSLFSSAGIALVVLRKGFTEGMVIVLGAAVAITLLGLLVTGNMLVVAGYGLLLWFPIFLIALILRQSGQLVFAVEIYDRTGGRWVDREFNVWVVARAVVASETIQSWGVPLGVSRFEAS